MASKSVYGSRQIGGPGAVDRGSVPTAALAGPVGQSRRHAGVLRDTRETSMTHNARHRQRMELPTRFTSVPKLFGYAAEIVNVYGSFETCGGLKNRRLRQCKILICEVLISVTLSVRGEVAERLKAAVC